MGRSEENLLALNEALDKLEKLEPRCARLIDLRFFGGLKEDEAAEVLGISLSTEARLDVRPRMAHQATGFMTTVQPGPVHLPGRGLPSEKAVVRSEK